MYNDSRSRRQQSRIRKRQVIMGRYLRGQTVYFIISGMEVKEAYHEEERQKKAREYREKHKWAHPGDDWEG